MKKIVVLVLAMVVSTSIFSITNEDYRVFNKLNRPSTLNGLVRYLNADLSQSNDLEYVFSLTSEKLKSAINADSEAKAERAITFNLVNVKAILTAEQYKKYLLILNVSRYDMPEEMLVDAL